MLLRCYNKLFTHRSHTFAHRLSLSEGPWTRTVADPCPTATNGRFKDVDLAACADGSFRRGGTATFTEGRACYSVTRPAAACAQRWRAAKDRIEFESAAVHPPRMREGAY